MKKYGLLFTLLAVCGWVATTAQTTRTGYFVTTLGRDTIAVEQFTADAHALKGTSVVRAPRTTLREYEASFGPNGELDRFHITMRNASGTTFGERDYVYTVDSVRVTFKQDTVTRVNTVAAKGQPYPFFVDLFAGWDNALYHAIHEGTAGEFGVLAGRQVLMYKVEGKGSGMLELVNPDNDFGPLYAMVDNDGELLKLDLTSTTDKFVAVRVQHLDVKAMAAQWAAREKSGSPMGVLSPSDTVNAEVNGAHLRIDYSRPAARGRTIFGGVVPWNEVWRTGANAATQLVTDKELLFGTTVVPPGTYSLFTLPSQHEWQLIINRQHGQWGTDYDQSKDLARLPLKTGRLSDAAERFTFGITSHGNEGVISFRWAETEAAIQFTVGQ